MVRNGKEPENPSFSLVAATFEKAITQVVAERLIRNAEARSSTLLCSTIYFQPFTATGNGGFFGQVANTWTFFPEFNCTASTAARKRNVLSKIRGAVSEVTELSDGFRYQFASNGELIPELANLIQLEPQCCPFLKFRLTVEPGGGSVFLEMTGPEGTKGFVAELFG
jgi:hypothetical protein